MKNTNILVIIDANKLGNYTKGSLKCKNYSYLEINKYLHENIVNNFYFKNNENVSIKIAIPEIVLEEIKEQQNHRFKLDLECLCNLFQKFSKLNGAELKIPEINYETHLEEKGINYLGVYDIITLKIPKNEIFPKLVKKVLKKEKPFYKKNGKDSGFKDALIWESILEFAKSNKYDRYFFLTDDSDFNNKTLSEEFHNLTGKEISIVEEVSTLKGELEEEINGTERINKTLEKIEPKLADILGSVINKNYLEIIRGENICKVSNVCGYRVLDINLEKERYQMAILANFEHESIYSIYAQNGAFDEEYLYNTEISPAELILSFDDKFNLKKIFSEEIIFNGKKSLVYG
jgi:hypothetical protein